jgi:hypothetical protein
MRRLIIGGLSVALFGCAGAHVDASLHRDGLARAAFDLNCPADAIKLVYFNGKPDDFISIGEQVGATGCGQRAVYILSSTSGWVANSASTTAAPPPSGRP